MENQFDDCGAEMCNAINNYPDLNQYDIRSIRACISGSAPLMPETQVNFEKLTGGNLREGYGLSEAPTQLSTLHSYQAATTRSNSSSMW